MTIAWNYLGTERIGRYTDLPNGSYTLHLKGANDDGVWNDTGLALRLTVVPPFWETRWFWGLIAVIVILGAVGGYRIRVVSVQARNRELEQQIVERTKESELRRKELETLYQADEVMYHHLNLDPLLEALVDIAVDIMHADKSAVYTWSDPHPAITGREQAAGDACRAWYPPTQSDLSIRIGRMVGGLEGAGHCHGCPGGE